MTSVNGVGGLDHGRSLFGKFGHVHVPAPARKVAAGHGHANAMPELEHMAHGPEIHLIRIDLAGLNQGGVDPEERKRARWMPSARITDVPSGATSVRRTTQSVSLAEELAYSTALTGPVISVFLSGARWCR